MPVEGGFEALVHGLLVCFWTQTLTLTQRVQVAIYQILRPQSTHIESPLRPKYIIQEYLDPLGKVLRTQITRLLAQKTISYRVSGLF